MVLSIAAAAQSQSVPETPKVTEFYVRYQASPKWHSLPEAFAGYPASHCLERHRECAARVCAHTCATVAEVDAIGPCADSCASLGPGGRVWCIRRASLSRSPSIRKSMRGRRPANLERDAPIALSWRNKNEIAERSFF